MATQIFWIKKDDTAPAIQATLTDSVGATLNLSGASVRFFMTPKASAAGSTPKVDAPATIVDIANGVVKYQWITGDTDMDDQSLSTVKYRAEFQVTFLDGRIETFPNTTYIEVRVVHDLGDT